MLKHILFSILLLFSFAANADNLDDFHNKSFKAREAEMSDSQRAKSFAAPVIEATFGCATAQNTRIAPFNDSNVGYVCQGVDNVYNNGAARIIRNAFIILNIILTAAALYLLHKSHFFELVKAAFGHGTGHNVSAGNILALIAALCLIPFIPAKVENVEENTPFATNINAAEFAALVVFQAIDSATISFTSAYYKGQPLRFPAVDIANPKNNKMHVADSLIDFAICSARQPGIKPTEIAVYFNDQDGSYQGSAQVGGCVLELSAESDQSLQTVGKAIGIDYNALTARAFGEALQKATDRAAVLGNTIAQRPMPLPGATPTPYDRSRLIRGQEASYNVAGMDSSGRSELARDAALLIGEDFTQALTRYPGLNEADVPQARMVQMCRYLPGATTYTDPGMSLTDNLKACAQTMCGDASSPTLCGQALGFYQMYSADDLKNPNTLTQFGALVKTTYFGGDFKEAGRVFANSISLTSTSSNTNEGVFEKPLGEEVFSIIIPKVEATYEYDPLTKSPIIAERAFEFTGDLSQTVLKIFSTGKTGILGLNGFNECLQNPNTIRENGLVCGNVFQTIHALGMNWLQLGTNIVAGTKINSLMTKTPIEKNKAKAAVRTAIKDLESSSKMAGITGFMTKMLGTLLMHSEIEDVFDNTSSEFTKEDIWILAVAYSVPVFNSVIGGIGKMLFVSSYFLTLGVVMTVALAILSKCMNMLMFVVVKLRIFADMIRTFNSGCYENEIGFFKPFNEIIVFVLSLFMFPVVILMAIHYGQSIFTFGFMQFDTIFTHHNQAPTFTDLSSVAEGFIATLLFVLMILLVISSVLKFCLKPQTIINMLVNSKTSGDEIYEDAEISTKRDLI